jgi:hypothetical protein
MLFSFLRQSNGTNLRNSSRLEQPDCSACMSTRVESLEAAGRVWITLLFLILTHGMVNIMVVSFVVENQDFLGW